MVNQAASICRRYRVFGRVQGVWYRASARDQARALGLSGWVRNREDGSVEALACGAPGALDAFANWLKQGPPAARVERVEETSGETGSEIDAGDDFLVIG